MKILMVNKFYHIKGGSETYFFGLKDVLESKGNTIIPFSMKDDKNFESEYEEYFIDNIRYENLSFTDKIKNAVKIIYNTDAKNKISHIISEYKPEIAHLHLFQHQLSPSILSALKEQEIPIVYTVHDLKPVCLNYKMMNSNGICEECKGKRYYNCFKNKCVKGSRVFSFINMMEGYFHSFLKSYELIDKFITPSHFYREKLIEHGIPEEKVVHIANFLNKSKFQPSYDHDDYFIYVGRLSEEKGILTLVKAMKRVKTSKLIIVGTGPLEKDITNLIREEALNNIDLVGFKTGKELENLIRRSRFSIIPSEWYENGPMSVLESMAYGKAVIGSDIGGIPEFLKHNNGLTFKMGDYIDLSNKINFMLKEEESTINMGRNGRIAIEKYYDESVHYDKIYSVYTEIIQRNK